MGGFVSYFLTCRHPEVFGNCAGQSSYLGQNAEHIIRLLEDKPLLDIRWYLDIGTYETMIGSSAGDFLDANRALRDYLRNEGYEVVVYAEFPEGHSWGNWKAHIDDILETFWPL